MKRVFILAVPFLAVSLWAQAAGVDLHPLHAEVCALVARYYPQGRCELVDNRIQFDYKTRPFCIHEALLTGEWQDAFEVRGPERGGIWGNIQLVPGPYDGQAMVPQSWDKRYFVEHLRAPYSKALDAHLHVLLRFPPGFQGEFLNDLTKLLDAFDRHLAPK